MALSALFVSVGILLGCGARSGGPVPDREPVSDTAVVVCGRDETRVLTPRVRARQDGVHFRVSNRLGGDTDLGAVGREGGAGVFVPKGETREAVGDVSPGKARAGCEEPPLDGIGKVRYAPFEVVDPGGLYRSVELECPSGRGVFGSAEYASGADRVKGDPVEMARRQFSDKIRTDDVVELAGYPKTQGIRLVRVVRGDRVMAMVSFSGGPDGWLQDSYEACQEF